MQTLPQSQGRLEAGAAFAEPERATQVKGVLRAFLASAIAIFVSSGPASLFR